MTVKINFSNWKMEIKRAERNFQSFKKASPTTLTSINKTCDAQFVISYPEAKESEVRTNDSLFPCSEIFEFLTTKINSIQNYRKQKLKINLGIFSTLLQNESTEIPNDRT